MQTTVKVKDGSTVLIAGLIKEKSTEARTEIPFLGRLPFIGWLFGSYEKGPLSEPRKQELIIAITPHIITGESGSFAASNGPSIKGERQ
ncbi:MAG: hypothetical protein A3K83_06665 [Omnitrophica WOR_2 bacterium RBG_13_44_8b]|nr:MAG: hypothetical protein A3K83_06665 [Omnitrophica WOR_2 bacterium RBG_13_44_8b]